MFSKYIAARGSPGIRNSSVARLKDVFYVLWYQGIGLRRQGKARRDRGVRRTAGSERIERDIVSRFSSWNEAPLMAVNQAGKFTCLSG